MQCLHRCIEAIPGTIKVLNIAHPFSIFAWVAERYDKNDAVHRCLSLARMYGASVFVVEDIPVEGLLREDAVEFQKWMISELPGKKAIRISFWKTAFPSIEACNDLPDDDCIGYMILQKAGKTKEHPYDLRWVVFEAVLNGGNLQRGIVPHKSVFQFRVGNRIRSVAGRLYCQQNGVTSACAHVAIRSIISALRNEDVSYREINEVAQKITADLSDSRLILTEPQIEGVFRYFKLSVEDMYSVDAVGKGLSFYRFLYAGIESGAGSLLGFKVDGPKDSKGRDRQHVIPLFGHTFNKHMWVNDAMGLYFPDEAHMQGVYGSDNWTSTFIGHDDNIGPNIYVPRHYVKERVVTYALAVLSPNSHMSGVWAESEALSWLFGFVFPKLKCNESNVWLRRLRRALVNDKGEMRAMAQLVLRALFVTRKEYIEHLKREVDWDGKTESGSNLKILENRLPDHIWMVEVSFPHLFPANERKIGELLFDAKYLTFAIYKDLGDQNNRVMSFLVSRFPEWYFIRETCNGNVADARLVPSGFASHIKSFAYPDAVRVG